MRAIFPRIETMKDIRAQSQRGVIAGFVFIVMIALGVLVVLLVGNDPLNGQPIPASDLTYTLVGLAIEIAIILFLIWRIWSGTAYVSAGLLLLIALVEFTAKMLSAPTLISMVLFTYIAIGLINAIRGGLAYDRVESDEAAESFF